MKSILWSFRQMVLFIKNDMMLVFACIVPILCGYAFKFGIPILDQLLTDHFNIPTVFLPYYVLFDLFFVVITPTMFCFIATMVVLEEIDEHIAGYLSVTPLRKKGYLISRLGIPAILAFVVNLILLPFFKLTEIEFPMMVSLALLGAVEGLTTTLIVVSFSSNKLEGMAVMKFSSLFMLGIPAPFFINSNIQYLLSPLPSFWLGKAVYDNNLFYILLSFILSSLWIALLTEKFMQKIKN